MKQIFKITILVILLLITGVSVSEAAVRVKGYYKPSSGIYVMPSYRSSPNKYKFDNYSSKGNYNPYSGKKGYRSY